MFNPYSEWLALPPELERPNYFQMLRVSTKVVDPEEIAKAAQRATVKVRSAKPGEHSLEWTQLVDEIETARKILSNPETRKAYVNRLVKEKKAREQAEAKAASESHAMAAAESPRGSRSSGREEPVFEEQSDEEVSESASAEDEEQEEVEDDDPMAAWSAAYGGGKKTAPSAKPRPVAGPAFGPNKGGLKKVALPASDGPIAIKRAVKGRSKPGVATYALLGVLFLVAVGGAAFGGAYALKFFESDLGITDQGPGTPVAVRPSTVPDKEPNVPAVTPRPAPPVSPRTNDVAVVPPEAMAEEPEAGMTDRDPEPAPPATSSDPFAPPTADPELAASAAPDDPFFVEPTLLKFGFAYDPNGATTAVAMTPDTPSEAPMGRALTDDEKAEVNAALTEIRGLLGRREVPAAEKRIAELTTRFEGTTASAKIESVSLLTQNFRQFWIAVVRGSMKTQTGVPLEYAGTSFSLVEATPQEIVVRTAGENKRWTPVTLPGGLAKFFAENDLNVDSPQAKVVLGTIYVLESGGAKADQAMEYWDEAAQNGEGETVSKLLPLLSPAGWKIS